MLSVIAFFVIFCPPLLYCPAVAGGERQALLHCFGLSVGLAAMQMCLTVRNETVNCRAGINTTVYVLAMVGHLKNVSSTFAQMPDRSTNVEFTTVSPTIANTMLAVRLSFYHSVWIDNQLYEVNFQVIKGHFRVRLNF